MKNLDEIRKEINQIDLEMAKLFEERMKCSLEVAEYKKANALPIYDLRRETEVINKNVQNILDNDIRDYYVMFLQHTMDLSKAYQSRVIETMKIAYCGVEGAYAYICVNKMFPNCEYQSYASFNDAYMAVVNGDCDTCVLPLENSFAGDVGVVMDLIFSGNLYINQVYDLEISHHLLGKKGTKLENIKTIISHEQAINQCINYINQKKLNVIEVSNTAVAAKQVANGDDYSVAAIASKDNAKLYNLEILDSDICSSHNNTTRFGAFSRSLNYSKNPTDNFILVFTVNNVAGSLAKTLNIIGSYGFNMRSLRSRPMKDLIWNYYFYVEIEGNVNSYEAKEMIKALKIFCDKLKIVGTYSSDNKK